VAEHFRDQGRHVLFLADSITRFAEAHREIALAAGEPPSYRGFPPSVSNLIMALAERAGPGPEGAGDITGIFSVLVAGSDMEEPVADILRGTLDGHVVLERSIAERAMIKGEYAGHNLKATIAQIANPLAEKVKATLERITSKRSTDLFLIVGGGADLVKDKVIEFAGEEKTIVPANPDEAIARGVSKMLLARLKKNPAPAKKSGKKEIEA